MLQKIFYWKYLIFSAILLSHLNFSQELNCKVTVNYSLVNQTESNVFNELEKNINVFLNENKWTNDSYLEFEKINCSFLITIVDYSDSSFRANIECFPTFTFFSTFSTSTIVSLVFLISNPLRVRESIIS